MDLNLAAQLAGWPTPAARDWKSSASNMHGHNARPLNEVARLAGWPTARSADGEKNVRPLDGTLRELERKGSPQDLVQCAAICGPARLTADGDVLTGSDAGMVDGGQLNPAHSRWIMGYPPAWDDCGVMAMPSSRSSRRSS